MKRNERLHLEECSDMIGPLPTPCHIQKLNTEQRLALWWMVKIVRKYLSRIDLATSEEEAAPRA